MDEAPFILLGPRPPIPPGFWATYWGHFALASVAAVFGALFLRRFLRRAPAARPPFASFEAALREAEQLAAGEAIGRITRALRAYLAAIEPRAAASLSTEELLTRLGELPVFLPARQPLTAVLRSADAAKFAGSDLEVALLIAGAREAARRVEDARLTFARPVAAPLLPARSRADGPPPLPRRDAVR